MYYSEFAELYSKQAEPFVDQTALSFETTTDLVEAKAIAAGVALQTYLTSDIPNIRQVALTESFYAASCNRNRRILMDETASANLKDKPHSALHNSIGGHLISATFTPYLFELGIEARTNPREQHVNSFRTQLGLSLLGLGIANERSELASSTFKTPGMPYKLFSKPYQAYDRWSKGVGNEIDAALILLEFVRKNPGTVLLPTPPQFERGHFDRTQSRSNQNIDYLLLRPETKRIAGIQIKSQVNTDTAQKYHPSVVMISGRDDMDNTKAVRIMPNSSAVETITWPGYMALHRLMNMLSSKDLMRTLRPAERIRLTALIRRTQLTHSETKPNFQTAYNRVQGRLKLALEIPEIRKSVVEISTPSRRSGKSRHK